MGGCVSRPKELDGYSSVPADKPAESEATVKPVKGGGDAPAEEAKAETITKPEIKEEPLLDLSESKPEAEKSEVVGLSPEITQLTVNAAETVEISATKEDTPVAEQVTVSEEKEKVVEEKAEKAKDEK